MAGSRNQPLVLVFEDLQWFDSTSIDLVRALSDGGGRSPILLLATAQPEFRPAWDPRAHHKVISLAPLAEAHVQRMIDQLASRRALSTAVKRRMSARAGGLPLFIEEVRRAKGRRGHSADPTPIAGGAA